MRKINYVYLYSIKKQILKQLLIILVLSAFYMESIAQEKTNFAHYTYLINSNCSQKFFLQNIKITPIISIGKVRLNQLYANTYSYFYQMLDDQKMSIRHYNYYIMNLQIYDVVKEVDILKKQRSIYLRSRLILIVLFLTLSITIIISVLAFRLRSSNIILEKLTKNRDKLFTIISHDLRSPLNSYQRYAEIVAYLIKTKQFDRLDEALKKIDEIGLNLAALLNNLLDWSLFKQIPNTSIINIQVFFNELLPIYRDMANLKGLVLVETFQDKVVRADPHLLSLITRNLLDNAIKYTHVNNEVIIGTHRDDNDLILMVSNREDSMSDIQKEKISALFNNNYDYEFGEEGLGIGLILIKEFAQSQNIKITFYHNPDNLTTFEVRILQAFV